MLKERGKIGKRGQLSIFVIIGIILVVVIAVALFAYTNVKSGGGARLGEEGIESYVVYVDDCLEQTTKDGLVLIGRQGGYYKNSLKSFSYSGSDDEPSPLNTDLPEIEVSYYLNSGDYFPTIENIEFSLSKYVEDNLNLCVGDFKILRDKGFEITAGEIKAEAKIMEDKTIITLNYPVVANYKNLESEKQSFEAEVEVRLGELHGIIAGILEKQKQDMSNVCLSCFVDSAKNNGFYTQLILSKDNTVIFILTDTKTEINGEYYDFIFANKYG